MRETPTRSVRDRCGQGQSADSLNKATRCGISIIQTPLRQRRFSDRVTRPHAQHVGSRCPLLCSSPHSRQVLGAGPKVHVVIMTFETPPFGQQSPAGWGRCKALSTPGKTAARTGPRFPRANTRRQTRQHTPPPTPPRPFTAPNWSCFMCCLSRHAGLPAARRDPEACGERSPQPLLACLAVTRRHRRRMCGSQRAL
jgi:hypothetical protein